MSKQLYKLTNEFKMLENLAERDYSEEELEGVKLSLDSVRADIEDKIENIAKFVLSLQADAEVIKSEEQRLKARKTALLNRARWLKDYMFNEMTATRTFKIKREVLTVSIQQSQPSVNVVNLQAIPEDYTRTTIEANKFLILKHFKDTGEVLDGIEVITDKRHLVIR